jgi:hypothetical protein
MAKPWPDRDEAIAMPVEELALRLLDRLEVTRDDQQHSLLRKDWFVNGEVTRYVAGRRHIDGVMRMTRSEDALAAEPQLARAWSEAWDLAVREGWLADDPARRPYVYVTGRGRKALSSYRGGSKPSTPASVPTPPAPSRTDQTTDEPRRTPDATAGSATDDIAGASSAAGAERSPRGITRFLSEQWKVVGAPLLVLIVGGLTLYYLTQGRGSSSSTPPQATATAATTTTTPTKTFTVQNDVSHGAWIVTAPVLRRLYPREHRPSSAKRWVADGTRLSLVCAKKTTPYAIIVNLKKVKWRWWARVASGGWIPMGPLKEALKDGSQGLPPCE